MLRRFDDQRPRHPFGNELEREPPDDDPGGMRGERDIEQDHFEKPEDFAEDRAYLADEERLGQLLVHAVVVFALSQEPEEPADRERQEHGDGQTHHKMFQRQKLHVNPPFSLKSFSVLD